MQRAKGIGKLERCEEGNQYLGGFPWVVSHSTYVLQCSKSECFWQAFLKWSWWSCTAFLLILLILWINWSHVPWQHLFWITHSQMHHPKLELYYNPLSMRNSNKLFWGLRAVGEKLTNCSHWFQTMYCRKEGIDSIFSNFSHQDCFAVHIFSINSHLCLV